MKMNVIKEKNCPVAKKCSGCQLLNLSYEEQLALKQNKVERLLKGICKVEQIVPSDMAWRYRNKAQAAFSSEKGGKCVCGVYQSTKNTIVPIVDCQIQTRKSNAIIDDIKKLAISFKIKPYNYFAGNGCLKQVIIRTGFTSGEILVCIVTAAPIFPAKNKFCEELLKLHPEITTIVHTVNKKDILLIGENQEILYGKGYILDTLCGHTFKISAASFYQINPVQTQKLYRKAIELAGLSGRETVVDAYCGIGTIGITAADRAKAVIGIELNRQAIADAKQNAKLNNLKNVQFICGDAGAFMEEAAQNGEKLDVLFMDPPRAGSSLKFIDAIGSLQPEKIVYISCNPETLARDLRMIKKKGYLVQIAIPFDMFPNTNHVESVVLMSRK